jgi:cytidine deaminase
VKPSHPPGSAPVGEAELLRRAREVKQRAYAPYSNFRVGAAVASADGHVFVGVNVENASYGLTMCAERNAIGAMAAAGVRSEVVAVAVVGDGRDALTPCGACRQVIFEFGPHAMVYGSGDGGRPVRSRADELLPHGFGPKRLSQGRDDA